MKTLNKILLTIGVLISLCATARAQSFSFGLSAGYGGLNSIGFSYGGGGAGVGVGFNTGGYYAPYGGYYGYPYYGYGYPYCYGYPYYGYTYYGYGPTCYSYAPAYPVYATWAPVYAAPVYYNTWWGVNSCWGWNNCWNSGWCNTGWNGGWNNCGWNNCGWNNGCWNGGGFAVTHPGGSILPPPTVGLQQTGMNPRVGGGAGAITGGRPGGGSLVAGNGRIGNGTGRGAATANGQMAGSPGSGYRTIHSLAWNNNNNTTRAASSPQMGNTPGRMTQFPIKNVGSTQNAAPVRSVGAYQPVRTPGWNASSANYSAHNPPQQIHSLAQPVRSAMYQPVRSTTYQPVRTSPGWYHGNQSMLPSTGARYQQTPNYQQMPSQGWKGANQAVRAPVQSGNYRSYAPAPSGGGYRSALSGGNYRPSGGNFTGGSSGFSGHSFGGGMGSFGGGGFHR